MLVVIDIGNSNIVLGLFDKEKLFKTQRIVTDKKGSAEGYIKQISDSFIHNVAKLEGVIIGSVVPELDRVIADACKEAYKTEPLFANTTLKTGLKELSCTPSELGADRLADIVASTVLYPGDSIVVDLGTAIKFEAISSDNEYIGGAIAPGIGISFNALIDRASKLDKLELSNPKSILGTDTKSQLNSGFVLGFSSMITGMIQKMKIELGWKTCHVIGTGGFIDLISPHVPEFTEINKDLTLEGLRLLWEANSNKHNSVKGGI